MVTYTNTPISVSLIVNLTNCEIIEATSPFAPSHLQHACPNCQKGFRTKSLMKSHRSQCVMCTSCGEWKEPRHLPLCKRKVLCLICDRRRFPEHKCPGKKLKAEKRIHCALCLRFITTSQMRFHYRQLHGKHWIRAMHPECLSEVLQTALEDSKSSTPFVTNTVRT